MFVLLVIIWRVSKNENDQNETAQQSHILGITRRRCDSVGVGGRDLLCDLSVTRCADSLSFAVPSTISARRVPLSTNYERSTIIRRAELSATRFNLH